jgi:hypothetical protein
MPPPAEDLLHRLGWQRQVLTAAHPRLRLLVEAGALELCEQGTETTGTARGAAAAEQIAESAAGASGGLASPWCRALPRCAR